MVAGRVFEQIFKRQYTKLFQICLQLQRVARKVGICSGLKNKKWAIPNGEIKMIRKILALVAFLAASSSVMAGNCNLQNIKGNWIWYLPGTDAFEQINQQCSISITVARGNSSSASLSGLCTDLVSGYIGYVQPESFVSFAGKSCNLTGQLVTEEVPPIGWPGAPTRTVTTNINTLVATNKKSLSGSWFTSAPINPLETTLVASGSISGQVGIIAEPIYTIQYPQNSEGYVVTTPPCPGNSCNAPGHNK